MMWIGTRTDLGCDECNRDVTKTELGYRSRMLLRNTKEELGGSGVKFCDGHVIR